ncbi:Putative deoxyribonuclease RhsC [Prevotella melaninogenica]|uniref:RHS repeat domain-containing protein n=1 Tax=Prevotella melaninogenica TaxID=28132 RepID=UPI001A58985A|nr:RHS repeat-associated core domain-containing protein [Prevotella melaninogenica]VTY04951.1 Putative deoxyribonuclease RhsC [Prevotella melaninogenica]
MLYDNVGRPAHQRVRHNGRTLLDKSYLWGDNLRLLQTLDTINRRSVRYDYDTFGSLSGAVYDDGSCQWRNPDVMGNVYDSPDRTDRSYGRGGQLREDRKWRYYYDSHGNLVLKTIRRIEPSCDAEAREEFLAWQSGDYAYTWQGNGMLRSVTRPDGKTVTFRYDALGRRIEKVFDGRVYRYLWDGDVILHEWDYTEADRPNTVVTETGEVTLDRPEPVENLITWVYDSDSYAPTAKIVGERHYSIISDYIGRPVQAYDDNGNIVWQADYDIYGDLRNIKGIRDFIPFRQLGQYEDDETRLYYNRFRYYDPRIGNYISQDPIRLAGNNPTLYGYVGDLNNWADVFGLKGGGSYSSVRSSNIGGEVHHTPANSINGLSHGEGPSIWMETTDYRMAYSHGWQGKEGALYRQTQLDLINQGKFADAIQMDIDDILSSFGSKYDSSINEMLDYSYEKGLISEAERDKMKICTK